MKIAIGSDHAGYELKMYINQILNKKGFVVEDFGANSNASVDYPDYAHPLSQAIEESKFTFGILICGSANGVCITANKHKGVRAAIAWTEEIAQLSRAHNDSNILCLPARFIGKRKAAQIVNVFLNTEFEGGRHATRVAKIQCK